MKKYIFVLMILLLFISCNASILMTNGEMEKPQKVEEENNKENYFSSEGASSINATKSYYSDSIVVRWSSVDGADYYSLEKAVSESNDEETFLVWKRIGETIEDTRYIDTEDLESGKYYYYRVTAHTFDGKRGEPSKITIGTILSSPKLISTSKGISVSNIEIEWNQMPFVESYRIYKSTLPVVSGLESEYITTIEASSDSLELVYSYEVDPAKEVGKELYFAIEGVGPTGERAPISLPRSGYTFVPGSPEAPEVVKITKGDDTDAITISFKKDKDDVNWIIKRFSLGSSESIVYSGEYGDDLGEADEEGLLHFVDKNVKSGVEYTYSIIAYNSIGSSPATTVKGYLLSPVSALSLVPITKENGEIGYEMTFQESIGSGDEGKENKYKYKVSSYDKNNNLMKEEIFEEGSFDSSFYPVVRSVTSESEKSEIWYVTVSVRCGELSLPAIESERVEMLPVPVNSISATKNEKRKDGESPNSNGVYPVTITWTSEFDGERIIKRVGSDGSEKEFKVLTGLSYVDNTTLPLVTYDYCIDTSDSFGRSLGEIQHTGSSYGSLDEKTLIRIVESVSLKPFESQSYVPEEYKAYWKKSQIATMVGYGNASDLSTQMKALGTADDKDHFRDGRITYNAEMEGVGGAIYFSYSSFGENQNLMLDGSYEMHVNASGTGSASSSTGGLDVRGMYNAHISLDKISVSKKAFVGSYIVTVHYSDGDITFEVEV